ncbi:YggS family pyridoxal phosphate-dependent enzyme [Sphingomicrobium astaxanthinifaciens]|uniref:YggS family pyridoxal phosphate-dependent enzyme n=1 Tax=Sphingomicrobium astaxanthinifaciens TaxID=1227949 RepID=UPI001FCC22F7|nr:YggS family pyridoxal phosphate-dependent enzyme [Sphingomicrobium astaxanthinifaciens]MCJ7421188.1 YggS family pyridoxal phosphate-dependent enzyme [Sphingomicrobium astaxanthinifaciens]
MHKLEETKARIALAARRAGREALPTLVAVSKTRTPEEIRPLLAAGQRDFGENRVQEAQDKWPALKAEHPDVRLHMVGQLQSNKAQEAVALFDAIHSLDRPSLVRAIAKAVAASGRRPDLYVQVNIGAEPQKGGVAVDALGELLALARGEGLSIAGLMCIPPADLESAPFFALLAELARRHDVAGLSMGMSHDVESAVIQGASVVRIGTALFGPRG